MLLVAIALVGAAVASVLPWWMALVGVGIGAVEVALARPRAQGLCPEGWRQGRQLIRWGDVVGLGLPMRGAGRASIEHRVGEGTEQLEITVDEDLRAELLDRAHFHRVPVRFDL